MPTIYREAGYAFRFRSSDRGEPPHVHVEGHSGHAKFWLAGPELATSTGYNRRQLRHITTLVNAQSAAFLDRWHEFFD